MSETKADLEARVARLEQENENLRGQLAASGAVRPVAARHTFRLNQGQLAELEMTGYTVIDGARFSTDEVRARLAESANQSGVQIADVDPAVAAAAGAAIPDRTGGNVVGVDFTYPSVARGQIDPAVAGTPGISGPAATDVRVVDVVTVDEPIED